MSQFGNNWGSYGQGPPPQQPQQPQPQQPPPGYGPQPGFGAPGQMPGFGAPVYGIAPYQQPMPLVMWGCRWCGFQGPPAYRQKVSGAGIAVTIVLAMVFLPLFWIGLLMKESVPMCPMCRR